MPDSTVSQSETSVRVNLDDATMDRILDDLTARAGHHLNLARWDLKAILEKQGYGHTSRGQCDV